MTDKLPMRVKSNWKNEHGLVVMEYSNVQSSMAMLLLYLLTSVLLFKISVKFFFEAQEIRNGNMRHIWVIGMMEYIFLVIIFRQIKFSEGNNFGHNFITVFFLIGQFFYL